MAKRTLKRKTTRKIHKNRKKHWLLRREILLLILAVALLGTGFYLKEKIQFYYAMYFNKFEHKKLSNSEFEEKRINRIIGDYADKTFGIDMSHYQRKDPKLKDYEQQEDSNDCCYCLVFSPIKAHF